MIKINLTLISQQKIFHSYENNNKKHTNKTVLFKSK